MSSTSTAPVKIDDFTIQHSFVKGMPTPPFITEPMYEQLMTMGCRPTDVLISTYPKAGTTWMQQIVRLIKGSAETGSTDQEVPWIETLPESFKSDTLPSPRCFKSHLPYALVPKGKGVKYIYVARNGKDGAVSLFHHARAFKPFQYSGTWDHFFLLFMRGAVEFGSWFEHIKGWHTAYLEEQKKAEGEQAILFLFYEDMKKDLEGSIVKIAKFIGADDVANDAEKVKEIAQKSTFSAMKENPKTNFSWLQGFRKEAEPAFMRKVVRSCRILFFFL